MADKLTIDISPDVETSFLFPWVEGEGVSLSEWDFSGEFGRFEEVIKPIFEESIDATFKEEAPFYFCVPQIESWSAEPEMPLTLKVSFGFNEDRDQHIYQSSLDERIASEFETRRYYDDDKYDMDPEEVLRFQKFAAALRELADKIDVELTKVVQHKGQTDD